MTWVVPRRVTFSRNFTLSLSRTCVSHCKYCAFATHRAHLHEPDEVERLLDERRRGAASKELLVLTGERPEVNAGVARAAAPSSASRTSSPTSPGPASGRSSAGCCRTRTSARSSRDDLARLREVTASQGLMLESMRPPTSSPTRARRPRTRRCGWRRSAPPASCASRSPAGSSSGIGETEEERDRGAGGARRRARRARPHPGGDPPELRPAPALLRRGAGGDRRRGRRALLATGVPSGAERAAARRGPRAVTLDDMKRLVRESRRLMPDVGIQIPPNLADWWPRARRRGRDRPRRAVRQRRPHLARASVPVARTRCASGSRRTATR